MHLFSDCEEREEHHGDSCYRFVTDRKSRDESVEDCIQHNSHLVYVETSEEQTFLANTLSGDDSLKDTDYWLGLVSVDVTYIWMDGNTSIASGLLPIEDVGGNCVFLTQFWGYVVIQTYDCSDVKNVICEKGMLIMSMISALNNLYGKDTNIERTTYVEQLVKELLINTWEHSHT